MTHLIEGSDHSDYAWLMSAGLEKTGMHQRRQARTTIDSDDFDAFVSEVAIRLWNDLQPMRKFQCLETSDFADLFALLQKSLKTYRLRRGRAL